MNFYKYIANCIIEREMYIDDTRFNNIPDFLDACYELAPYKHIGVKGRHFCNNLAENFVLAYSPSRISLDEHTKAMDEMAAWSKRKFPAMEAEQLSPAQQDPTARQEPNDKVKPINARMPQKRTLKQIALLCYYDNIRLDRETASEILANNTINPDGLKFSHKLLGCYQDFNNKLHLSTRATASELNSVIRDINKVLPHIKSSKGSNKAETERNILNRILNDKKL